MEIKKHCKHCFNCWNKSGNRRDFDNKDSDNSPLPLSDFAGPSVSPKHSHEFVHQFPDVFEKSIGH